MMEEPHFYHFLAEGNIICDLESDHRDEAIETLCRRLAKNTGGLDPDETVKAVVSREDVVPTVVSPGLAVPHARLANVKQLLVALGTSLKGIDFKAPGAAPVNVMVLILTPKDDPGIHLQVLAALAKDFKDPETVRQVAAMETPVEILKFFSEKKGDMPSCLRARDVMNHEPVTLFEGDTLGKAIETFAIGKAFDIPVIDEDRDIRGVIALEDILRLSLPEHLLWMDDLSPILNFQPFAELLRSDSETKLADFMRESFVSVDADVPAIQLAKIFLMERVRQIIVTEDSKLAGVVGIQGFCTKLFWA